MTVSHLKVALVNIKGRDMFSPPLGLAYLATYARQHIDDVEFRVIDVNFEHPIPALADYKPDIVGISSITMHYNRAIELAGVIKKELGVPVILGGVHISTCTESFLPVFDLAVLGEGELTLVDLLKLYKKTGHFPVEGLEHIPGLLFFDGQEFRESPPRPLISNLDIIPVPDRRYFDQRYFQPIPVPELGDRMRRSTPIMTARGCPFNCVFCSTSAFWQRVRTHSPAYVAREVRYLVDDFGINHVKIWDDTVFGKPRLRALKTALADEGVLGRVTFNCQVTASLVDDELCDLMQQTGFVSAGFGFESGSEHVLKYLKGGAVTVEHNLSAIEICKRHGIYVMGSLMMGSPGETVEDMQKTLAFIDAAYERGADQIHLFTTQPFPGTQLWDFGVEHAIIEEGFDFDHTSKYDSDEPLFLDANVPSDMFHELFVKAKRKIRRFPAHSPWRRLRLLIFHPLAVMRAYSLQAKNYSLWGVRAKRFVKRMRQLVGESH